MQVDERAAPVLRDASHGAFERGMAFAACRAEDVAHQAMRVHADQHRGLAVLDISSQNEGHMRLAALSISLS